MMLPALLFFFCLSASDAFPGACPQGCVCYGGFVSCQKFKEEVLGKLPTNAETLILYGGEIKSFPPGFLRNFTKLTFLEIQSTQVDTMLEGTFAGLVGLDQMALASCTIGSIEAGAFKDMDNLSKLFVSESQIGSIQTGAFSRLNNVGQFNIWSSTIGTVEPWAFSELSDFQSFSFYMNNVSVLSNDAFVSVTKFGTVDVYLNRFTSPIQGGSGLGALKEATTDINVYSNVFVCGCEFVKAFQQPFLAKFKSSQKCTMPGQGRSATTAAVSLIKLSEINVDAVCADTTTKQPITTSAQTTSSPSTATPKKTTSRSTASKNTTTTDSYQSRSSDASKPTGSDVMTTKRPGTTTGKDSSSGELSLGNGGDGDSVNSAAGPSGVFKSAVAAMIATLLQACFVSFLPTLLIPTTRPIASFIS